jgi:1-phosphofructokinase family hexose kinase
VLIAGPNLTIDRTSRIPALRPGEVLRLEDVAVTPGGKGLNVARAARALGVPAALVAFVPGRTGRAAAELIADEGVALRAVPVTGEIRSTSVILEPGGRATVLNEPGPALADGDWAALEAAIGAAWAEHRVLVCSGSLPPASPEDGYGRLVALARAAGRVSLVDAGGVTLRAALAASPDVVKPNLAEAEGVEEAVHALPDAPARAVAAGRELVRAGARAAVVTAAEAGAVVVSGEGAWWIPAPRVEAVVNPIGAGDVLAAGLASGLEAGLDVVAAACRGVAAAAAGVQAPLAGDLDAAVMDSLLAQVKPTAAR